MRDAIRDVVGGNSGLWRELSRVTRDAIASIETQVAVADDASIEFPDTTNITQNWRGLRYRDTGYHEKVLKNQRSCIFWKVSKPQNIQEPATCGDAHAYPEPYTTFSLPSSPFFAARKRDTLSSSAGS
jgi:hypothetical protein